MYMQPVPKLLVQINTRGREHQNKYTSMRNIRSLKSTCNVRKHFVSGADVSCCVSVADWECVLTFKTALWWASKYTDSATIITACDNNSEHGAAYACWNGRHASGIRFYDWKWSQPISALLWWIIRETSVENRWIGRNGPVAWPSRSPDLTCLDFFLWGHMKQLVYEAVVETEEDLVTRITVAVGTIADMPGIFERTRQSMVRRCTACIEVNGRAFEQFLWMPLR